MGDAKRWSVTYTKHVKQKRKVYQDGFLELQSSGRKGILYDECDKLLDSRFLNKEDVVKTGETLAFGSFLVDIGDAHGDHNTTSYLHSQGNDKKYPEKPGSVFSSKFGHSSSPVDTKPGGKKRARGIDLSPSQKIIREFKKSETLKYDSSQTCPQRESSSRREWQVLYTTQITQKAKKFHDGYLQLVVSEAHCRQVMLYDASRRLLGSRFLKKDEKVNSGQSLVFDGHLIEIGDSEGDPKPPMDLTLQGRNSKILGKSDIGYDKDSISSDNKSSSEWQVLYTTHITQKEKLFHDGYLQLLVSGSFGRQVMLYDTTRRLLDSRFLKKNEIVTSGESLVFCGHLVDIGDHIRDHELLVDLTVHKRDSKVVGGTKKDYRTAKIPENNKYPAGEFQNHTSSEDMDSNVKSCHTDGNTLGRRVLTTQPLSDGEHANLHDESSKMADASLSCRAPPTYERKRAAKEILSILRKPTSRENVVAEPKPPVDNHLKSQCMKAVCGDTLQECDGEVLQELLSRSSVHEYVPDIGKSGCVDKVFPINSEKLADPEDGGEFQTWSSGSGSTDYLAPIRKVERTDHSESITIFPATDPQELVHLKSDSACDIPQLSELREKRKLGNATICHEGASHVISMTSDTITRQPHVEDKTPHPDLFSSKMDDIPSFDLGFE